MAEKIHLSRILLTNDDGIDAPGMIVLAEIAATLADEVWIVAPEHDKSGISLHLSLHHPRRIYPRGPLRYAVDGSPADCVALASFLMRDTRPQLLLSGINAGHNLGDDSNLSGTVGAALAGLMLRIPSIAISQCCNNGRANIRWDTARAHLPNLLQAVLQQGWRKETCLSINLPDLPPAEVREAVWVRQAQRSIVNFRVEPRTDLRGNDYFWLNLLRNHDEQPEGTDSAAVRHGKIAIACLSLDRSRESGRETITLAD